MLAGGYSTRFGEHDKALSRLDDQPLLMLVVEGLAPAVDGVVVNCRQDQLPSFHSVLRTASDDVDNAFLQESVPVRGPAAGLQTVSIPYVALIAADMPFVDAEFFGYLFDLAICSDGSVPYINGHVQPIQTALLNPQRSSRQTDRTRFWNRESEVVRKTLFRFNKQVASLAQKHSAAGLPKVSNPSGYGFAGWKHVVCHYLRIEMGVTYEEVVDWASEMDRVRTMLNLPIDRFPHPSTLCRSFNRTPMSVWRVLLARSARLLIRSGHMAINSTFFTCRRASPHYLRRIDRSVGTLKETLLVDVADQAIINEDCSTRWLNDAKVGPKLARRNVDSLVSLAADKGYDSTEFRAQIRENGIRPLIKHRLYRPIDYTHNARLGVESNNQRALFKSVNSSIKRSIRESIGARCWFRQFRELVLVASVYNVNQAIES